MKSSSRQGFQRQKSVCVLEPSFVETGFRKMQTKGLPRADDGWISPCCWSAKLVSRLPPVFVSNGSIETLFEEGREFVVKAKKLGVQVEHYVAPDHPHDFAAMLWFAPSIGKMFRSQGAWVRGLTRS